MRHKYGILRPGDAKLPVTPTYTDIIDVSEYNRKTKPSRDPPALVKNKQIIELVYEPVFDDWPIYEEPCFQVN